MRVVILILLVIVTKNSIGQETITFRDGKKFPFEPMLNDCIRAAKKSSPNSDAIGYCNCILKLAAQHFTTVEMKTMMAQSKVDGAISLINKLKSEAPNEFYSCAKISASPVKEQWTKTQEQVFLKNCVNNFNKNKSLNKYSGEKYCRCYLESIKNEFSDKELLDEKNKIVLKIFADDCLAKSLKVSNTKANDTLAYYYNEFLIKICSDINKTCPFNIDKDTRMENVVYTPSDTTLTYNFKFVNLSKQDIDLETMKEGMQKIVSARAKDDPTFNTFREMKVHVSGTYYDKNNFYWFTIQILE